MAIAATALITGGNRGIGLATARGLAAQGHPVILGCRDADLGAAAAASIPGARSLVLDLEDPGSIQAALAALDGPVDILVNNAGFLAPAGALEVSMDDLRRAFEVHLFGPLALIRSLLPGMTARGFGRIVNLSSGWGSFHEGLAGPFAYSVSKAALDALTLNLSRGLPENVKINACCPGWIRTRSLVPPEIGSPST